jgi:hypothetical protein
MESSLRSREPIQCDQSKKPALALVFLCPLIPNHPKEFPLIYTNSLYDCLAAFAIAFIAGVLTSLSMSAWAEEVRSGQPRFPHGH